MAEQSHLDLMANAVRLLDDLHYEWSDNYDYATDTGGSSMVDLDFYRDDIERNLKALRAALNAEGINL